MSGQVKEAVVCKVQEGHYRLRPESLHIQPHSYWSGPDGLECIPDDIIARFHS